MGVVYTEPPLAVLVLDFKKPWESRLCLESVKQHVKVPHTVIFCDNGSGEDYAMDFVREGLVDQLIVNRDSRGLGLGTRDLFAAVFAPVSLYLQNDQVFVRDFTEENLAAMVEILSSAPANGQPRVCSISLAGAPCGDGIYSERAHVILTSTYLHWESADKLGYHGAGPYHDGPWREAQIQEMYKTYGGWHMIWPVPFVQDNGVFAVRDMKEGGLWCHRTDTKQLWCIRPPTVKNPAYPKLTDEEFARAARGEWVDGAIPEVEVKDSFDCWSRTELAQRQDEYIVDLRLRSGGQTL